MDAHPGTYGADVWTPYPDIAILFDERAMPPELPDPVTVVCRPHGVLNASSGVRYADPCGRREGV
jgi:hypothetical protein